MNSTPHRKYSPVQTPNPPKFKFIDLFAGLGGIRIPFDELGGQCVFTSEWDKEAQRTYEHNFGEKPDGDITKVVKAFIPDHDILLGGFPCQPFSIAGVSKKNSLGRKHGFEDEAQGTLFYDICEILKQKRPSAFLLENVKNLRGHDKGNTFRVIQGALDELGYTVYDKVIDAKHYTAQHRERIFIVGFAKEWFPEKAKFTFPADPEGTVCIGDILDKEVPAKYTLTNNLWRYLQDYAAKHKAAGNGFGFGLVNLKGKTRTLSARYYKDGSEILIPQGEGKNPRRLTPEECKRLQGYPEWYNIKDSGVSDMRLYKQFGNSVAVPVVRAVAQQMIAFIEKHKLQRRNLRNSSVTPVAKKRQAVKVSTTPLLV